MCVHTKPYLKDKVKDKVQDKVNPNNVSIFTARSLQLEPNLIKLIYLIMFTLNIINIKFQ